MVIKTGDEYIESLRERKIKVYLFGEKVKNPVDHPIIRPSINSVAVTYDVANDPKYEELATVTSNLTGEKVNRFTHIHQNTYDLVKKVKLLRLLGQKTGVCFQRCVGMDSLNALSCVTFELDQKFGTEYYKRFTEYVKHVQGNDLVCCGAMTDPKGDRSLRPSQQADPDLYLRIVEQGDNGIVVRGSKVHQTGAVNSHEVIVMPTRTMREEDKDYAVSFAIPADTEGLIYIYGRQSCDLRKLEDSEIDLGNVRYSGQEAMIVLDDVFVPWERVFMAGEHEFTWPLVNTFSAYHRQSYGGCKAGVGDVLIGAAATIAEYNGVAKASHIRDKIIEMNHLNETIYSCGIACSAEGHQTPSGTYLVDILLSNICKLNVTRFPYEIARLAEDIAGGLLVTLPSEKDFKNPETRKHLDRYLKGVRTVPTKHRLRMLRLIENIIMGLGAVGYRVESMHGAGSPQAQRIMIEREEDIEFKKNLAKSIAGIKRNE
ncbi:MAG: 4-hydroxyphenylacetate 3-hydroxylase family protein [Candidatus Bathyarchaeota archaeon]|nr:4-hydroxyphenylacetate 3-hydroxylase family protein [Candidatus Bathyarchaeota archaeon]MDH5733486.1 4-hydroxyphenylacetate 3-hydroxylase family protein [Candidatus Bathyarchaeota archaeon]